MTTMAPMSSTMLHQRRGRREFWINPRFDCGRDPVDLAEQLIDGQGQLICTMKDDHRSHVVLWQHGDHHWVVKQYRGPAWKTFWYHLVRRTPAWREWRYARLLRRIQIRVIDLWSIVHEHRFGQWSQFVISPYVSAPSLQSWLNDPANASHTNRRKRVALAVGRQVGLIAARGCMNRDHKVSNLLIDQDCEADNGEPLIIDPARVKRRWSDRSAYHMLALLSWTADRAGPVTKREKLTCLRATLSTDESLAQNQPRRLRHARSEVEAILAGFRRLAEERERGE